MSNNLTLSYEMVTFLSISIIVAWFTSQTFKAILNCAIAKKFNLKFFFKCFFADGDFPSSHTAFSVTSLIVMLPYAEQVINDPNSTSSDITICRLIEVLWVLFVFVIVKDAIGVRGALKKLSSVVKTFLSKPEDFLNDDVSKELQSFWSSIAAGININVGHFPHEVIGGVILALIIGMGANSIRLGWTAILIIDCIAAILYFASTFYILTNKERSLKQYKKICALFRKRTK